MLHYVLEFHSFLKLNNISSYDWTTFCLFHTFKNTEMFPSTKGRWTEEKTHSDLYHINITILLLFVCFSLLLIIIPPPTHWTCPPRAVPNLSEKAVWQRIWYLERAQSYQDMGLINQVKGKKWTPYKIMIFYCLGYKLVLRYFHLSPFKIWIMHWVPLD